MKIAIITDKSRTAFLPGEEAYQEDKQKRDTIKHLKSVLSERFDCIDLIADNDIITRLEMENIDLVFNLCNGIRGNDKLAQIPALLEFAGIPYTGSSILGHSLAINKHIACDIFKNRGIATPDFFCIYNIEDLEKLDSKKIKFPVIVKPSDEGSGRGIHKNSLVYDIKALKKVVIEELSVYNPPIMITEYIDGREFTVGILGNDDNLVALPILQIGFDNLPDNLPKFYSFEVKAYYKSKVNYTCPANISDNLREKIETTAKRAFKALHLNDYARVDIRVKKDVPYVLEINSLPGLTKGFSSLARMANAGDLGYEGLVFSIVESAMKRYGITEDVRPIAT